MKRFSLFLFVCLVFPVFLTSCGSPPRYEVLQFADSGAIVKSYEADSHWLEGTCISFTLSDDPTHAVRSVCGNVAVVPQDHARGEQSSATGPYVVQFYTRDGKLYPSWWSATRIWREQACIGFTASRDDYGSVACGKALAYNRTATWNPDKTSTGKVIVSDDDGNPVLSWWANDVAVADGVTTFWLPGDMSRSTIYVTGPVSSGP